MEGQRLLNEETSGLKEEFGTTRRRWLIMAFFMTLVMSNQFQYAAFTTIVPQASLVFGVSTARINLLAALFPLIFAISVLPGMYLLSRVGLRKALICGAALNFCGALIKLLALTPLLSGQYWALVVGSLSSAVSQVTLFGTPPTLASIWFPDEERTLATSMGTFPAFIGFACSVLTSTRLLIVGCESSGVISGAECSAGKYSDTEISNTELVSRIESGMRLVFIVQCIVAFIPVLGLTLFLKNRPTVRPSSTAEVGEAQGQAISWRSYLGSCKNVITNPHFLLIAIVHGNCGLSTACGTLMAEFLGPFGIAAKTTGTILFVTCLAGAASTGLTAKGIECLWGKGSSATTFKKPWVTTFIFQLIFTAAFYFFLVYQRATAGSLAVDTLTVLAYIFLTGSTIFQLPQYPITFEFTAEVIYPEPAALGGSFLIVSVSLFNAIGNLIISYFTSDFKGIDVVDQQDQVVQVFIFSLLVGLVAFFTLVFAVEEKLSRAAARRS